jgi:hypothetical protein
MSTMRKPLCLQAVVLHFSCPCEELLSDVPEGEGEGPSGIEAYGVGDGVGARSLAQIVSGVHLVAVPTAGGDKFSVEVGASHSECTVVERAL